MSLWWKYELTTLILSNIFIVSENICVYLSALWTWYGSLRMILKWKQITSVQIKRFSQIPLHIFTQLLNSRSLKDSYIICDVLWIMQLTYTSYLFNVNNLFQQTCIEIHIDYLKKTIFDGWQRMLVRKQDLFCLKKYCPKVLNFLR